MRSCSWDRGCTVHVIERPANAADVRVGTLTGCTNATSCEGDDCLGDNRLVDAATGMEGGTLMNECFVVDTGSSLHHCPGNTEGRGTAGVVTSPGLADFVITITR